MENGPWTAALKVGAAPNGAPSRWIGRRVLVYCRPRPCQLKPQFYSGLLQQLRLTLAPQSFLLPNNGSPTRVSALRVQLPVDAFLLGNPLPPHRPVADLDYPGGTETSLNKQPH